MSRTLPRVLGVVGLIVIPGALAAQAIDTTFVDVDGHRVALYATGIAGGPTVVMEAGGGSWHRDWVRIAPRLATEARVIMYDRPGYRLSEPCDSARTAERVSRELNLALNAAGYTGPVIMVGWSLGGAFARVFAGTYPERVRGLVLVDPAPTGFYPRMPREYPDEWSLGVAEHFSAVFSDSTRRAEAQELAAFDASMAQARASDARHATPSIVLIAGRDDEVATDVISRVWVEELSRWAATRPRTTVTIVPDVGHHIPAQAPDAIVKAVIELIARTK